MYTLKLIKPAKERGAWQTHENSEVEFKTFEGFPSYEHAERYLDSLDNTKFNLSNGWTFWVIARSN